MDSQTNPSDEEYECSACGEKGHVAGECTIGVPCFYCEGRGYTVETIKAYMSWDQDDRGDQVWRGEPSVIRVQVVCDECQ